MKFDILQPHMPAFGLQLNGTSLKFLQLQHKNSHVKVLAYSHIPLPKNMMSNDDIIDAAALAEFIAKHIVNPNYGGLSTNRVILSLPESRSFVRVIQIPQMAESQAENTILFESEAYIPLPIDQVYFDWKILGPTLDKMEVLIIASPKDTVDKYMNTIEAAHLKLMAVEVESQSLERALVSPDSTITELIIDIDSFKTSLVMIERGNLQFSSSIPIAGNAFTETIAQSLGVSSVQADQIKREVGFANTPSYPNIKTALLPLLNTLGEEVKNIIRFHNERSKEQITRVVLSGGNARIKNLSEFLSGFLKEFTEITEVKVANPWHNIKNLQNSPLNDDNALNFVAPIGLALRGLS